MEVVVEEGTSVILSSHLVADLERVCDYLVVLISSRVQVAGEIEALLATHHRLVGPGRDPDALPPNQEVIEERHTPTNRARSFFAAKTRSSILPGRSNSSTWRTLCLPTWPVAR